MTRLIVPTRIVAMRRYLGIKGKISLIVTGDCYGNLFTAGSLFKPEDFDELYEIEVT